MLPQKEKFTCSRGPAVSETVEIDTRWRRVHVEGDRIYARLFHAAVDFDDLLAENVVYVERDRTRRI